MKNDVIRREAAINTVFSMCCRWNTSDPEDLKNMLMTAFQDLPSAQPEDYTELKREFLRMADYIDVLLECSDEQKETLIGFILRLAELMPWTERD